ncbi:MAG: hypothetical protein ACLGI3_12340 [Actinomycetes bacterium]
MTTPTDHPPEDAFDVQQEPPDGWPTIVRLPLLPSPDEMLQLRDRRARIEDELAAEAAAAARSVAQWADALGKAGTGLDQAVRAARAAGVSWSEIGRAAGISRQAATMRWGQE